MNSANTAKKCFDENIRLFSDPRVSPEKYNHYQVLGGIAESVIQLSNEIQSLRIEVQSLRAELRRR